MSHLVSEPGPVWTVRLDSPPANALGPELVGELEAVLDAVDPETTRVLVVQSTGRFFSAGVDISMMQRAAGSVHGVEEIAGFGGRLQAAFQRIEDLPIPTVAVLQGHALGGGLELALACDLRVADETALVGLPETKLGLIPGAGGTQRVTRIAGRGVALRLILRGELAPAGWAEQVGLVQWCVPKGTAAQVADDLAQELAALPQAALAACKHSIALAPSPEGFASEIAQTRHLLDSDETRRRFTEFLEKSTGGRGR